jgi:type I restriction enzyme M protein
MLTSNFQNSGLRQKVDQLMDILWSGGVNNPMDSIEQLSYLIFLRLMSERDEEFTALSRKYKRIFTDEWSKYEWGNFVTLTGDQLFDATRSAIENLHKLPGMSKTGQLLFERATLKIYDRPTLRAVIQVINDMDMSEHEGIDLKGDMYEYLLSKLSTSGTNGQFRTPRHIIDLIVELVDPQPGEYIADPACGTAGFLISAFKYIMRHNTTKAELNLGRLTGDKLSPKQWDFIAEKAFTGYDNDANMVKIAILNLYLHKLEKANIQFLNPLTTGVGSPYPGKTFDVVLANPPFSGRIQKESILEDINLSTRATERLFLKWFIDHLAPGGRGGVIVPSGILFGTDNSTLKLRQILIEKLTLHAVITIPSGVFKPYASVATAILIFENKPKTKSVWFYEMTADGYSLSDTRTPINENDIPDILEKWHTRAKGKKSFSATAEEIAQKDFTLMPSAYKEVDFVVTEHETPVSIISDVLALENDIQNRLSSLMKQVKK